MIYIDFQGGAHGNYLEFVCNKFLAKVDSASAPFNSLGASHSKQYTSDTAFKAWHYFEYCGEKTEFENSKIISIQINYDDLLPLSSVSSLRAGDRNIDNNQLEFNTYGKLPNSILDNLINGFFKDQIRHGYNAVKDESWPEISSVAEFKKLPGCIQDECINIHNLQLLELTSESPDCPRNVLREFFKLSYKYPEQSGFILQQEKMTYNASNDVRIFPYASFYDIDQFIHQLTGLSNWLGYLFVADAEFINLHNEFLSKQPFKNSKKYCDKKLERIISNESFEIPNLDLYQESYLTAKLELHYNIELPNNPLWFTHSRQILELI
jgi:hypothetical protein